MGRNSNFLCKTCKKNIYLGYGSYITWLDNVQSIEEYDLLPDNHKNLSKNKNLKRVLEEHKGHEFFTWSGDCHSIHDRKLWFDAGYIYEVVIEDYYLYKQESLDDNKL